MLIFESPSLKELNHERYIPEGIAGGLCLHAHVLTISSFLDEVIHQGELFRRLELHEIAEEKRASGILPKSSCNCAYFSMLTWNLTLRPWAALNISMLMASAGIMLTSSFTKSMSFPNVRVSVPVFGPGAILEFAMDCTRIAQALCNVRARTAPLEMAFAWACEYARTSQRSPSASGGKAQFTKGMNISVTIIVFPVPP